MRLEMTASKTNSADGASLIERLNRDVDEIWPRWNTHRNDRTYPIKGPDGKSSPRSIYGDPAFYAGPSTNM